MEKIKIGIIGYGSWVKKAYIPSLKQDGRAEIVAISARSESTKERLRRISEKTLISIRVMKIY